LRDAAVKPGVRLLPAGDTGLVVEFGQIIDPALNGLVRALDAALAQAMPRGVTETVPTLRSLLVHYDPLATGFDLLAAQIEPLLASLGSVPLGGGPRWRLPVCYGGTHGPDLEEAAQRLGLSGDEIVRRHAGATYRAGMLGFLPGCAFLLGLPPELELPRRASPRTRVPGGSVAMALSMSLVYPTDSPGGWHLLGHCPVPLFDVARAPANLLAPGDEVRFEPVTAAEIAAIAGAVAAGGYDAARECAT
jgi:inhibitor of KinA